MYACDWILTWYRNSSIMSHSHWFGSSISKGLSASGGKAVNGHSSEWTQQWGVGLLLLHTDNQFE